MFISVVLSITLLGVILNVQAMFKEQGESTFFCAVHAAASLFLLTMFFELFKHTG
jgi:hypothetical protein